MKLPIIKIRERHEFVLDVHYQESDTIKEAAWVFDTREAAEKKLNRLIKIELADADHSG